MQSDNKKSSYFFQLYIKYQKRIYAYILMLVPNVSDADDILQQVSSFMWERFDTFEPGTNFGAWATRIARNFIFDYYKSKRRSKIIFTDENLDLFAERAAVSAARMEERVDVLQKCLKKLPEADRKLMKARYEEGLKIKQIAHLIGRPVGGLYKAINRIHNVLIKCIRREMFARGI